MPPLTMIARKRQSDCHVTNHNCNRRRFIHNGDLLPRNDENENAQSDENQITHESLRQ